MGKKSRRKRTDKWAHIDTREADAAKRDALQFLGLKEEEEEAIFAAAHERRRRRAVIAAAEAECRAAMAVARGSADKVIAERPISQADVPRFERAIAALMDAVSLDDDDDSNLTEYLRNRGTQVSSQELIKLIKRWPRIRKYYPRIRRHICSGCGKQYDLSEPRLRVCGECGEGRYCDEACQRAHWPEHRGRCLKTFLEQAKKRRSHWDPHGKTIEKLRQDFLELYPR